MMANPEASFEPVREAILDLREKVEDLCNQELSKITKQGLSQESCVVLPSFLFMFFFLHLIICSLPVNDTTLFTLGDRKYQSFFYFERNKSCRRAEPSCLTVAFFYLIQPTGRKEGFLNVSLYFYNLNILQDCMFHNTKLHYSKLISDFSTVFSGLASRNTNSRAPGTCNVYI